MELKMPEKKITNKTANANNVIKNHMIWSMGAGFIPVPFADFFAVSAIQLDMIRQLSKLYEIDFAETKERFLKHGVDVGRPFPPFLTWCRVSTSKPEDMEYFAEIYEKEFT